MEISKKYPKVLMVGRNYFCREEGCGVTMANLFKGWPKDRIAVVTYEIDPCEEEICNRSYLLGFDEIRMIWPFSLFQNKVISGIITSYKGERKEKPACSFRKKSLYLVLKKIIITFFSFLSLYPLLVEIRISHKLLKFIDEYNPNIIYSQLANPVVISLVSSLHHARKVPIVLYIQDDWPKVIGKMGIFQFFLSRKFDREFRNLINKASVLIGISTAMCGEYKKRYGREFLPFSNPIETEKWLVYSKTNWQAGSPFKILYAGRIGRVNTQAIFDLCQAIRKLKSRGLDLRLEIYSKDVDFAKAKKNKISDVANINNPLAHEEMPRLLASQDLLFLPLDFGRKNILYTQYSMSTKISEYMISGTPILIYASPKTALYKYAEAEKFAHLVSERSIDKLLEAIKDLYVNEDLRESYGKKAKEVAIKNHDATIVRSNFRKALTQQS